MKIGRSDRCQARKVGFLAASMSMTGQHLEWFIVKYLGNQEINSMQESR